MLRTSLATLAAVLAAPCFVLTPAPLSPTPPHRDRTSRLPNLVTGLRPVASESVALAQSLATLATPSGVLLGREAASQARATAV